MGSCVSKAGGACVGCIRSCTGKDGLNMGDRTHVSLGTHGEASDPNHAKDDGPDPYLEGVREYVLAEWKLADRDYNGKLSFNEILKLLKKLNIGMKPGMVRERFRRVDKDGNGHLDFNEFCDFLNELRTRPEIKAIFDTFSKKKHYWTVDDLLLFLHQEQFEISADTQEALRIIKKYERSEVATKLYFSGFSEYMASDENSGFNHALRRGVYQRMDQPLTHYYIASSHNTYIESHQLKGNSSVEAYISALKRGCKCLELDIWDGDDGQPIITHGHTMTSRIKFRDVVQAIKDYAFVHSPYPLILSLENHCSERQQVRMAEIFSEIFGSAGMLPNHLLDQPNPLPSPDQLKHKILIKGKVRSETFTIEEDELMEEEDDEDIFQEYEDVGEGSSKGMGDSTGTGTPPMEVLPQLHTSPVDMSPRMRNRKSKRYSRRVEKPAANTKMQTAKELSDLMHLKPVMFAGFQAAKEKNCAWEISSFSEIKVQSFFKFEQHALIEYSILQFMRIYPKATRFDSSNYPPMISWAGGCQLTALNYQTDDIPMWLNMAKFLDNGGVGYVLKPHTLLTTKHPDVNEVRKTLHVHLVSGWQLPKDTGTSKGEVVDPYVKIRMFGVPGDNHKYKTKVIQNDGFNPQWNEKVSFELNRADLAQILFEVLDQDRVGKDDFLGYSSIPVHCIKQGYRSIQLYDRKSVAIPSASLFVQLMLT